MEKILSDLITFKTFDGFPSKEEEVTKLYKYVCEHIPNKYKTKFLNSNISQSLIIYSKSLKNPKIVLQAHVDVVPGEDYLFKAKSDGKKIWGRGVSDMKFAVACYIKLLNELSNSNIDVAIWLTSDEEIGGFDGINYLVNKKNFSTEVCVLPDGVNNFSLVDQAKGVWHIKIETQGKSAHGSQPWEGNNAIERLIEIYQNIKNNQLFKTQPNHWNNTINIGKITGGESTNSVPNKAEANIDIRFVDENNLQKIKSLISKLQKKYQFSIQTLVHGKAYKLNKTSSAVKQFTNELKDKKINFQFNKDHGSSDARFFTDKEIDVIMFKPICGGDHSDEEWLDINSLNSFYNALKSFVINYK